MKTYKCEEMMCSGCVTRIDKALTEADIKPVSYTHLIRKRPDV